MGKFNAKELLLYGLKYFEIKVERDEGEAILTEDNLVIKIEKENGFRLFQEGVELALFQDVAELCHFIKTKHAEGRTEYRSAGK